MRASGTLGWTFDSWGDLAAFVGQLQPAPLLLPDPEGVRIINADVFEGLAQIEDESVNCVVTSPPYWGLRDYGTVAWSGGISSCDHVSHEIRTGSGMAALGEKYRGGGHKASAPKLIQFRDVCGKCGAVKADRQIGQEPTLQEHIDALVRVFREVRRVLRKDGTLWLNYGDSYCNFRTSSCGQSIHNHEARDQPVSRVRGDAAFKEKDLMLMPARLAIALQADGWYIRSEIIWHKPNTMPESARDRPTSAHEKLFLLTKSERYAYDADAVKEAAVSSRVGVDMGTRGMQGYADASAGIRGQAQRDCSGGFSHSDPGRRNIRNVWTIATQPYKGAHFATFPPKLVEPCIKAGCPSDGVVLDIFAGSGTVAFVSRQLGRQSVAIELNPKYCDLIRERLVGKK